MNILVVDDEPDTECLFSQRFRRELREGMVGLQFALSAESALEAANVGGSLDVVLILSDINLPGASGLDLLKDLKKWDAHLPVYMITPYDDDGRRAVAEQLGADGFLSKPLDFEYLRQDVLHL